MNSEFQKYLEDVDNSEIINELFDILTELDARDSCNVVIEKYSRKGWKDLCDDAIKLLEQLKA